MGQSWTAPNPMQTQTTQAEPSQAPAASGFLDGPIGAFLRILFLFVIAFIGATLFTLLGKYNERDATTFLVKFSGSLGIILVIFIILLGIKEIYKRYSDQANPAIIHGRRAQPPSVLQSTAADLAGELGNAEALAGLPTPEQRKDDEDQSKRKKLVEDSSFRHTMTPDIFPGPSSDGVSNPLAENPLVKCRECTEFLREYFKKDLEQNLDGETCKPCKPCLAFDKVSKLLAYIKFRRNQNPERNGCEICEMRLNSGKGLDILSNIDRDQ